MPPRGGRPVAAASAAAPPGTRPADSRAPRPGQAAPRPAAREAALPQPPAPAGGTQLQLCIPGESRHFDKAHWIASSLTGQALQQARSIAAELAATRGWNTRIVTETGRALAVVLADHIPGDMIAWSELSPALHSRDLSVTRTAEILGLAGLLHDDRVPSFTSLMRQRLAVLPAPMAADFGHWLRTRGEGGPRSRPRNEHTVRQNLNRVHPLLLEWARNYVHLREVTAADVIAATEPLSGSLRRQTVLALRSLFGHCKKTGRIFRDPTRGVRAGQRPLTLIQPLQPAEIGQATAAAVTPAARLARELGRERHGRRHHRPVHPVTPSAHARAEGCQHSSWGGPRNCGGKYRLARPVCTRLRPDHRAHGTGTCRFARSQSTNRRGPRSSRGVGMRNAFICDAIKIKIHQHIHQ